MTLVQADEIDCEGDHLSFITGREDLSAQKPQLHLLRQLLGDTKETVALVAGEEMVAFFLTCPLQAEAPLSRRD